MMSRTTRTMMTLSWPVLSLVSVSALLTACGTAAVPQELLDARAAYADAAKGPAADLAPAQLDTAKQSLDGAQRSFDDDGPSQKTKEQLDAERKAREASASEVTKTKAELATEKAARAEAEKKAAAAMASLAEIAKVKEESRGVVITLSGSVLFATAKSDLLPIAKDKLDQVAKALTDQGFKHIVVQGYTDSRGNASDNDALSQRRAQSVRDYLVTKGIPSEKATAEGLGSTRPVGDNATADGRAENRRVEIVVTPDKG